MTKAIVIPAGRQPAAVVDFEPGSRRGLAAFINDRAAAATVGLSAFGLDRQMAVLLYDDDAANRGELLNGTVLELLPDSFIAPSGQTLIFGNAVIVGFRDGRGLWTSVSPELVTELVRANRFWVEVRRWPQGPGEQVGPVYDSRSTAIGARDRWRNVILDRGIAGVEVSVAAEVGPRPLPAVDLTRIDMHQSIDGWPERPPTRTDQHVPTTPAALQPAPAACAWRSC